MHEEREKEGGGGRVGERIQHTWAKVGDRIIGDKMWFQQSKLHHLDALCFITKNRGGQVSYLLVRTRRKMRVRDSQAPVLIVLQDPSAKLLIALC